MTHTTKVSKQGNSLGVRLPKEFLESLGLAQGDLVSMSVNNQRIEITRAEEDYSYAMDLGKECAARYRHTLAKLAQ